MTTFVVLLLLVLAGPVIVVCLATQVLPAGTARNFLRLLFAVLWCTPVPGTGPAVLPSIVYLWGLIWNRNADFLAPAIAVSIVAVLGSALVLANSLLRLYGASRRPMA